MADVSKEALGKAYKAGYALPGVEWPQDATDEQKTPGPHHCPFSPGDPQRDEWLKGLKDRLTGPTEDPAAIVKQIDAELNGGQRMINEGFNVADKLSRTMRRGAELEDGLAMVGHCSVVLRDEHGEVKARREVGNLVVSTGRDAIIERLDSAPATSQPTHMAIGTGSTSPVAGNTALGSEIDRNALTSNTASGGVLTMVGNWTAGDGTNSAIAEAGVLNAASTGTLYSRATFTAINKGASDTLQITWTYTLTPS